MNLTAVQRTTGEGEVRVFMFVLSAGVDTEAAYTINFELVPVRSLTRAGLADFGNELANQIIATSTAIEDAGFGELGLGINSVSASVRFRFERAVGGSADLRFVRLGASDTREAVQEVIVEYGYPD